MEEFILTLLSPVLSTWLGSDCVSLQPGADEVLWVTSNDLPLSVP